MKFTIPFKIKHTVHIILCDEIIFDSPPFIYHIIFLKKLLKKFAAHIFTLLVGPFASKLVNYSRHSESFKHSEEFGNRRHFPLITAICQFSNILQRFTVPRIIDKFRRKTRQKKRKGMGYELL